MKKPSHITHFYYTELNGQAPISVQQHEFVSFKAHRHDFCEFEYVLDGQTQTDVNGLLYEFGAGDAVFVTPADIHGYPVSAQVSMKTIIVHFSPETFPELSKLSSCVIHCSEELRAAFSLLLQESRKEDPLSGYAVRNMLERILILANRENRKSAPVQHTSGVSGALAYIHKHFKERITMEDVCRKCGYSASSLCRNFKEQTGLTVVAYINKQRLDHAERMLRTLEDTVGDICFACGFTSVRQFNRTFKSVYGCTPTEYRNTQSEKMRL